MKYFWDPPPQKKKAQGYERSRYGYTDYECTQCTGGLLGIAQYVYSHLHEQMFD